MTETSKAFQLTKQKMLILSHLHSTESLSRRHFDGLGKEKKKEEEDDEKFAWHFLGTALTTVDSDRLNASNTKVSQSDPMVKTTRQAFGI